MGKIINLWEKIKELDDIDNEMIIEDDFDDDYSWEPILDTHPIVRRHSKLGRELYLNVDKNKVFNYIQKAKEDGWRDLKVERVALEAMEINEWHYIICEKNGFYSIYGKKPKNMV